MCKYVYVVVLLASPSGSGHFVGVVLPDLDCGAGWVPLVEGLSELSDHCVVSCP